MTKQEKAKPKRPNGATAHPSTLFVCIVGLRASLPLARNRPYSEGRVIAGGARSMGIDGISITKLYIYSCLFTIIHYMITSFNLLIY